MLSGVHPAKQNASSALARVRVGRADGAGSQHRGARAAWEALHQPLRVIHPASTRMIARRAYLTLAVLLVDETGSQDRNVWHPAS